ncbi:hypothetical protein BDW22DRAFT_1483926 [Trametopsis cervina]|nr:hypothetical protein BDW22DRAFT_1483926 [Trametopsis cervina]
MSPRALREYGFQVLDTMTRRGEYFNEPVLTLSKLHCLRELTVQFAVNYPCLNIVLVTIGSLLPRPRTHDGGEVEHGLPPLRYVTLAPYGELSVARRQLQFARVSAVLAGVPTLEKCTLDLRATTTASVRLEKHKAWFREHMAELHWKGVLDFMV